MKKMTNYWKRFINDQNGLEVVEYAIIVGVVILASLTALAAIGVWVSSQYINVQTKMGV